MRRAILGIAFVSLTMLTCSAVQARPVSYTGGWTFIEVANRASTAGLVNTIRFTCFYFSAITAKATAV